MVGSFVWQLLETYQNHANSYYVQIVPGNQGEHATVLQNRYCTTTDTLVRIIQAVKLAQVQGASAQAAFGAGDTL